MKQGYDEGKDVFYITREVQPLISNEDIQGAVVSLASKILAYCESQKIKELHMVGIARACVPFLSDLSFRLGDLLGGFDLVFARSMVGTKQGEVEVCYCTADSLKGKNVLLLDTILDTGKTMSSVLKYLKDEKEAKQVLTVVLFKKNFVSRSLRCDGRDVDFLDLYCEDTFVVGYGLDYNGKYRNLPSLFDHQDIDPDSYV